MSKTPISPPTLIQKNSPYVTEIAFLHVVEEHLEAAVQALTHEARTLARQPGFVATNVLASTDGTRICTYLQWQDAPSLRAAREAAGEQTQAAARLADGEPFTPRLYDVVYADDRSEQGVSVISPEYRGTIFINEISTRPETQHRLIELVVANNEAASFHTPGYRSANFHQSTDGLRTVNYSLWDSEAHLIQSISEMAEMDVNLEETMEIASPDFRFYTLAYSAHA